MILRYIPKCMHNINVRMYHLQNVSSHLFFFFAMSKVQLQQLILEQYLTYVSFLFSYSHDKVVFILFGTMNLCCGWRLKNLHWNLVPIIKVDLEGRWFIVNTYSVLVTTVQMHKSRVLLGTLLLLWWEINRLKR